jgi:beta-lactamase class A
MANPFEDIERRSGGTLGVAALHIERSRMIAWRADEAFPLGELNGFLIAVRALSHSERGFLPWRKMLKLEPRDMSPGHSPLRDRYPDGAVVTIGQLVEALVLDRDKTASAALLSHSGGLEPLQDALDYYGFKEIRAGSTSTPQALARFTAAIQVGEFLKDRTRSSLTRLLSGPIPGLPPDTSCWRFPGDSAVTGAVALPGGKEHVALAILSRNAPPAPARLALSEAAQLCYAYWSSR